MEREEDKRQGKRGGRRTPKERRIKDTEREEEKRHGKRGGKRVENGSITGEKGKEENQI